MTSEARKMTDEQWNPAIAHLPTAYKKMWSIRHTNNVPLFIPWQNNKPQQIITNLTRPFEIRYCGVILYHFARRFHIHIWWIISWQRWGSPFDCGWWKRCSSCTCKSILPLAWISAAGLHNSLWRYSREDSFRSSRFGHLSSPWRTWIRKKVKRNE